MITAFAALLVSQLAGEIIVRVVSLPIPGPVAGMMLLFAVMLARVPLPRALSDTAEHLDRLGTDALRLLAVVVLATAVTLAVTALVFESIARLMRIDGAPRNGAPPATPSSSGAA